MDREPKEGRLFGKYEIDPEGYVNFGDIARGELMVQAQYASYYVSGLGGRPKLSDGLKIKGDPDNYHSMKIHINDAQEFIDRVRAHRAK